MLVSRSNKEKTLVDSHYAVSRVMPQEALQPGGPVTTQLHAKKITRKHGRSLFFHTRLRLREQKNRIKNPLLYPVTWRNNTAKSIKNDALFFFLFFGIDKQKTMDRTIKF